MQKLKSPMSQRLTKLTISIDDGHPSDMRMADLLAKHQMQGTFYIPIQNQEGPPVLHVSELREIGRRFEIGSHTCDHRFLTTVDDREAYKQIAEGKLRLENMLGYAVAGFCYPGGKYRNKHIELVKQAGFQYARTTVNLCFDAGHAPFEMPTTCQFYPHRRSVYVRNFIRSGKYPMRFAGLKLAVMQSNWIKCIYQLFDHACETGSVFHLWCHSHDIDDMRAWLELDQFFAYASSVVGRQQRMDNLRLATWSYPSLGLTERPSLHASATGSLDVLRKS
jgi:hypothetical protein